MLRRNFLGFLAGLPFIGLLPKDKKKSIPKLKNPCLEIPLDKIKSNSYPIFSLRKLHEDMGEAGLVTPIYVHPIDRDRFLCIDGHRRLQVAKMLGWKKIVCAIFPKDYNV